MKIDLPRCNLRSCMNHSDGSCTKPVEYQRCEYIVAVQTLESIIGGEKLCVLCHNYDCDGVSIGDRCSPIWLGN